MSWVHCNQCYAQPSLKPMKMFLTNCPHCFCDSCIVAISQSQKCPCCNKQPVKIKPLDPSVNPDFRALLEHPSQNLRRLYKATIFHQMQCENLASLNKQNISGLKADRDASLKKIQILRNELMSEQTRSMQLEEETVKLMAVIESSEAALGKARTQSTNLSQDSPRQSAVSKGESFFSPKFFSGALSSPPVLRTNMLPRDQ